jgi:hypothetical protein
MCYLSENGPSFAMEPVQQTATQQQTGLSNMADIKVKNVRLAFPKIFTPEPFPGGNDPTPYFSCNLIMPPNHPQFKEVEALVETLFQEKWGKKAIAVKKTSTAMGMVFFRDGDAKSEYDGFEGNWFISARNKVAPTLMDEQKRRVTEASGILYAGCYVNAVLGCYAYTKGNNGLGASLMGLQKVRNGDAFGGARAADEDDFDEIAVEDDDASAEDGDGHDSMMD